MSEQGKEPWEDAIEVCDERTEREAYDEVRNGVEYRSFQRKLRLKLMLCGVLCGAFFGCSRSFFHALLLCFLFLLFLKFPKF